MSIANINAYHQLRDVKVQPKQLLLDPRNPRLIVDLEDDVEYSDDQISSVDVQRDIFRKINKSEHHIADLINGIRKTGFIDGAAPLIVKRVKGKGDGFLVLEGNRRTTAIKHLLDQANTLEESCRKTLERISAKEFIYFDNEEFTEDEVIDFLLGKIHISGALAWGAMEKAHYIFKSYTRELGKREIDQFKVDDSSVQAVSEIFGFSNKEILRNLKVYRVYSQLKAEGHSVSPDRFSLIDLAVSTSVLREDYFELQESLELSQLGTSRFDALCLTSGCPIKNPQLFKKFEQIFRQGSHDDVRDIENGLADIEAVHVQLKQQKKDRQIIKRLEGILNSLEKTNLSSFNGSKEEKYVVARIIEIVNKKLRPLVVSNATEPELTAKTIKQALRLNSEETKLLIQETMRNRPNNSCIERDLVKFVLLDLEIVTKGEPRREFKEKLAKQVDFLVRNGILRRQDGKNGVRLKLLV